MKTFFNILQLHSECKTIIYPDIINNNIINICLCNNCIYNNNNNNDDKIKTIYCSNLNNNFWSNIFNNDYNNDYNNEIFEKKTLYFQIYFFISSMSYFYNKSINIKVENKYKLYKNFTNNIFLSKELKENFNIIFFKSQKTYLSLLKFSNIIRHKISKEKVNTDLCMDIINPNSKFSIVLYHHNSKYFFLLTDLINIIQTAITNSNNNDLFSYPLEPKNPYNNIPFTKINLYNIYFYIKETFLTVPYWIQLFFLSDFNIRKFFIDNEQSLREFTIRNYVNNSSVSSISSLYIEIKNLLKFCNIKFEIHKDFPKKELVDIFRPYIYLYLIHEDYIEGTDKKYISKDILKNKMNEFYKYNNNFGKKFMNVKKKIDNSNDILDNKYYCSFTFNVNYPNFKMIDAYNSFHKK